MNPIEVHESHQTLQQQDFVFLHSSVVFSPSRNALQPNHYVLYLLNVYLEMIYTNGLPLGWTIFCGHVRFSSFRWYLFSGTTCFMDHQAFIFSSGEAGVNLVQSIGELTETFFCVQLPWPYCDKIKNAKAQKNCCYKSYVRWFKVTSAVFTWEAW